MTHVVAPGSRELPSAQPPRTWGISALWPQAKSSGAACGSLKWAVPSVPSPGPKLGSTQRDPCAQDREMVTSVVFSS